MQLMIQTMIGGITHIVTVCHILIAKMIADVSTDY